MSLECFAILKTQEEAGRRNAWWDRVARGFREDLLAGGGMAGGGASQRPAVGNGPDRVVGTGARVSADGDEQEPRHALLSQDCHGVLSGALEGLTSGST